VDIEKSNIDLYGIAETITELPENVIWVNRPKEIFSDEFYLISNWKKQSLEDLDVIYNFSKEKKGWDWYYFYIVDQDDNKFEFKFDLENKFQSLDNKNLQIMAWENNHIEDFSVFLNQNPMEFITPNWRILLDQYHKIKIWTVLDIDEKYIKKAYRDLNVVDIYNEIWNGWEKQNIHDYLLDKTASENNDIIFYDHWKWEIADTMTIKDNESTIDISFYHCKKMWNNWFNILWDIYEVVWQVTKSLIYSWDKELIQRKIIHRVNISKDKFRVWWVEKFTEIMKNNEKNFVYKFYMVQPCIKRTEANEGIKSIIQWLYSYTSISRAQLFIVWSDI
jgi:hypothetical protein